MTLPDIPITSGPGSIERLFEFLEGCRLITVDGMGEPVEYRTLLLVTALRGQFQKIHERIRELEGAKEGEQWVG